MATDKEADLTLAEQGLADWTDALDQEDVVASIHDWQKEELDRRKANLVRNPESALTWSEVKRRIRSHR